MKDGERARRPAARVMRRDIRADAGRKHFEAAAHLRWLERFWRDKQAGPSSDALLRRDRAT